MRKRKYKEDFQETVVHDDPKRKAEIEKNYHMEYIQGTARQQGHWVYVLKDPKTGEVLEKRANRNGIWQGIWRKSDEE